jgi:hypothetical protein
MASPITQFLNEEVYPRLDAVQAGFLESLSPSQLKSSGSYNLICPRCKHKERSAFYFPGSRTIQCPRKNKCADPTSLFDFIAETRHLSNGEVIKALADAVGVSLPDDNRPARASAASARQQRDTLLKTFKGFLMQSPPALNYLRQERGFSDAQIDQMDLGFYPDQISVQDALAASGFNMDTAGEWMIIDPTLDTSRETHPMHGRIVGLWPQPDGGVRLWGRRIDGVKQTKYLFADGLKKTVPYRYVPHHKGILVCVEGTLDADSLALCGIPACAIGGAHVIRQQARHFVQTGTRRLIHLIDGDIAGRRGGLSTVRICEALGIETLIAEIPPGEDDPDALRQKGQINTLFEILNNARTGGEFAALTLMASLDDTGREQHLVFGEYERLGRDLTSSSRASFQSVFHRFGIELEDNMTGALRTAWHLAEVGLELPDIQRVIERKFSLQLSLVPVQPDATTP